MTCRHCEEMRRRAVKAWKLAWKQIRKREPTAVAASAATRKHSMTEQQDHIKVLMRQALDEAFKQQIVQLYKVWLSNPADLEEQRKRTAVGAHNAIEVYCVAMTAVDNWNGRQT